MNNMISKTDFQSFRKCPSCFWIEKNAPEKLSKKPLSDFEQQIIEQGYEVENMARKLFPEGVLVEGFGAKAANKTVEFIKSDKSQIFQATFISDELQAMCDVVAIVEDSERWDIYEIKGTTSKDTKKEDYLWDLAFQSEVLRRAGINVGKLNLIELNKEYRKQGNIDPSELFEITDLTEEIAYIKEEISMVINKAKSVLEDNIEPHGCECLYKTKGKHCEAFKLFYPNIPEYSIYNLSRISAKKIKSFVDDEILAIDQIPDENELTEIQSNQVNVEKHDSEIIDLEGIKEELNQLKYPLYFLDYETVSTAIPIYDNCYPFQQVPFQFSLHVLKSPDAELEHFEYLHTDLDNPILHLVKALKARISDRGSVIVWNKSFESKCNKDMAEIVPEYEAFLMSINNRFYDLRDIFSKQYYVRREFKGSTSIKYVLPVLVPALSYEDLEIQDGGMASSSWRKMFTDGITDKEKEDIKNQLLEYCKLDTLAMVRILEEVMKKVD